MGQRAVIQAAKVRKRVCLVEGLQIIEGVCVVTRLIPSKTFREVVLSFMSRDTNRLNWDRLRENQGIVRFFKLMIAFLKRHPSLARSRFRRKDIHWYGVGPAPDRS